ncbi:uncharacterized protein VP01_5266g1 [Puccinia sorghi]|uniref:Uncharacterized protein n=1 Tax=Puccinia sorghi TaxID=27349 RepID=A0A0L6UKF6_9BASI|nr:uncharacterized protein VP01_5266g1 [Puccinia sorghi]
MPENARIKKSEEDMWLQKDNIQDADKFLMRFHAEKKMSRMTRIRAILFEGGECQPFPTQKREKNMTKAL